MKINMPLLEALGICFLSLSKPGNNRRFNRPIELKSFRARLDTMTRDVALAIGSARALELTMTSSEFLRHQTKLEIRRGLRLRTMF
jgi:hypothetical protein